MKGKNRFHYAWYILIACCALQGATLGLIQNSCGIFYRPICDEMGFELSAITLYTTLRGLVSCAVLPFVTRILKKKGIRITLSLAIIVFSTANILMGTCNHLWQWYALGVIQGAASSFMAVVTVPIILNNWFDQKRGLVIGLASGFSGVLGMIANPVGSMIIEKSGWRVCYYVFGSLSLIMILPFTIFVFRFKPSEIGLEPYGAEQNTSENLNASKMKVDQKESAHPVNRKFAIAILVCIEIIAMFCASFSTHLSSYGTWIGMQAAAAAGLASFAMAGNMIGKFCLGELSDKIGSKKTMFCALFLPAVGFGILIFGSQMAGIASLLVGISIPSAAVLMPLLIREVFNNHRFEETYAGITLAGSITYSLGGTIFGFLYDLNSSYLSSIWLCTILMLIGALLMIILSTKISQSASA